jgi:hypothetical protein
MKICPHCQTKYTDNTLQFCLQDGSSLDSVNEEKTIAFDQNDFSDDKTIAENHSGRTQNYSDQTVPIINRQTENQQPDQTVAFQDGLSSETILRPRELTSASSPVEKLPVKKRGGLGFLTGIIIGILLIGLFGVVLMAVIYLPSFLTGNTNTSENTNNTDKNSTVGKILSDTDQVKLSASSSRKPLKGNYYEPRLAFDGNSRTAWSEGARGAGRGQWIAFDFNKEVTLKKIIIEPGYFKTEELWRKNNRLSSVSIRFSDGTDKSVSFPNVMKQQKINTGNVKTKSVMITIKDIFPGQADSEDTLISEVKFEIE